MKLYSSVISKHLICPPPDRPDELHCSDPIVGHKDLLYHTFTTIAVNKFPWSCNLERGVGQRKGGVMECGRREGERGREGGKGKGSGEGEGNEGREGGSGKGRKREGEGKEGRSEWKEVHRM